MRPRVFVAHADTYSGYYAAREMLRQKTFDLVRVGVRAQDSAKEFAEYGAEVVQLLTPDSATLDKAMLGMNSMFLIPPPSSSALSEVRAYIDAAVRSGITNVVLMTLLRATTKSSNDTACQSMFDDMEMYLRKSGLRWCILHAGFVQQNLLYFAEIIQNKAMIPLPIGNAKFSPVNLKDIAIAVSTILCFNPMREDDINQTYTLTGPEPSMDGYKLAETASRILLSDISYHDITPDQMRRILTAVRSITEWEVEMYMDLFSDISKGALDLQSPDLTNIINSKGESIEEFFQENTLQLCPGKGSIPVTSTAAICTIL